MDKLEQKIDLNLDPSKVDDPYDKTFIKAFLYARVGVGLENHEATDEDVSFPGGFVWKRVNELCEELVMINPNKAFDLAIDLVKLKRTGDNNELTDQWYRTLGLYILGLEGDDKRLEGYINSNKGFSEILSGFMDQNISDIKSGVNTNTPRGWNAVQSVYVCLGLKNGTSTEVKKLYGHALEKSKDPDIKRVAAIFKDNIDDAYLAKRL